MSTEHTIAPERMYEIMDATYNRLAGSWTRKCAASWIDENGCRVRSAGSDPDFLRDELPDTACVCLDTALVVNTDENEYDECAARVANAILERDLPTSVVSRVPFAVITKFNDSVTELDVLAFVAEYRNELEALID